MSKRNALLSNIQRFSVHDGPGVRSTVFFKGCPLRCAWCHNPETFSMQKELIHKSNLCISCGECISACKQNALSASGAKISHNKKQCMRCFSTGLATQSACVSVCPDSAMLICGHYYSVEEVMREILEDIGMYQKTGGGLTLSGGEVCLQSEFALELLKHASQAGIHTVLDSSAYCNPEILECLSKYTRLFLIDIKHMKDEIHQKYTGVSNKVILSNIKMLDCLGAEMEVRVPIIDGIQNTEENIKALCNFLKSLKNLKAVTLLPYHKFGLAKIIRFDQHMPDHGFTSPTKIELKKLQNGLAVALQRDCVFLR